MPVISFLDHLVVHLIVLMSESDRCAAKLPEHQCLFSIRCQPCGGLCYDVKLVQFFQEFGTELILGFKKERDPTHAER
jgi:hypothetical protein